MCSIFGVINHKNASQYDNLLQKMSLDQAHRGPDDSGIFADASVSLGHRRLSIIDLSSSGHQPMFDKDCNIAIVFNGEIYNFLEQKATLQSRGYKFLSNSDTEVIIYMYKEYGIDFVSKLNGMFAIALYDKLKRKVFLIRDRMGKKPLFYHISNKQELFFASELSALKLVKNFELNYNAMSEFLSLQAIYGEKTIFQTVFKLAPSSILEFDLTIGTHKITNYYQLNLVKKNSISLEDSCEILRNLVTQSVQARMISDVPLGVFLSGGIDSSIISSVLTKLNLPNVTHAFTIGFDNVAYDERGNAALTTQMINKSCSNKLIQHSKVVDSSDFSILPKLAKHYGEPFADASMVPTFLLCEFAKEHVTVALSGDGADELFGGYNRYLAMNNLQKFNAIPLALRKGLIKPLLAMLPNSSERSTLAKVHRLLSVAALDKNHQYEAIFDKCPPKIKSKLCNFSYNDLEIFTNFGKNSQLDILDSCMDFDQKNYLVSDILSKVDIASMANSLELRSPFLDYKVVEFANSLPSKFKLCGTDKKHLLKMAFQNQIPVEVLRGGKKGFALPLADFFGGAWNKPMRSHLLESNLSRLNLFDRSFLEKLTSNQTNIIQHSHLIFSLIMLDLFFES